MLSREAEIVSRAFLKQAFAAVPVQKEQGLGAKSEHGSKQPWYAAAKGKVDGFVKRFRTSDPKALALLTAYKSIDPAKAYAKLDSAIGGPLSSLTGKSMVGDINKKYKDLGRGASSMKDWFKKKFGRNPESVDPGALLAAAAAPQKSTGLSAEETAALGALGTMTGQAYK